MESLLNAILSNAITATVLALVPLALNRLGRSPALVHGLWLVVLMKLVTPPLIEVPLVVTSPAPRAPTSTNDWLASFSPAERSDRHKLPANTVPDDDNFTDGAATDQGMGALIPPDVAEAGETHDRRAPAAAPVEAAQPDGQKQIAATNVLSMNPDSQRRWEFLALALDLVGCLVCWSLAAVRIIRLKSLLRDIQPAPAELQARVLAVAHQLALKRAPATWLVPGRIPPMLWTLGGRPRLLLPTGLWRALTDSQQTALIAHEMAHLKRKDHLVRWLDLFVTGLYWWHPVVWWARRGLREAEEQCCDAWAVWATPRGSKSYAAALLAALEFVSGAPTVGVAAAAAIINGRGHVSFLKRRMRMIVQARTPRTLSWAGRLAVLGLAALILPLAPTWARQTDASRPEADRDAAPAKVKPESKILNYDGLLETIVLQDRDQAGKPRQELKAEGDDDDRDAANTPSDKEIADHLESFLKDLGEKLSKDLSPVGEEILKTLDKAAKEVSEALDREGILSKDLRQALEKARDELHEAFREGSPLNKQARDAAEKAREDVKSAVEKAREEAREAVRERAEKAKEAAREGLLSQSDMKDEPPAAGANGSGKPGEAEQARKEIRQMEQQLRQAIRRLAEIERRDQRQRNQRRGPGGPPAPLSAPARPEAPAEAAKAPAEPPAQPEAPATPAAPRFMQRPAGPRGDGPGSNFRRPGMVGPGPAGAGGPAVMNPRVERRLRDLEDKMDRLLKELESLKGQKDIDKSKKDGDAKESSQSNRPSTNRRQPGGRIRIS